MSGPKWLDDEERAAWLGLLGVVMDLPPALDRQLRADAGIGHVYYSILAVLSSGPDRTVAPRDLARAAGISLSRLSHALDALQRRGWVTRCPTPDPRRQLARLTDAGQQLLDEVAPGHVSEVRRLVFDRLEPSEVRQLAALTAKLLGRPGEQPARV